MQLLTIPIQTYQDIIKKEWHTCSPEKHKMYVFRAYLITTFIQKINQSDFNGQFSIIRKPLLDLWNSIYPGSSENTVNACVCNQIKWAIEDGYIERIKDYIFSPESGPLRFPYYIPTSKLYELANLALKKQLDFAEVDIDEVGILTYDTRVTYEYNEKTYQINSSNRRELAEKIYQDNKQSLIEKFGTKLAALRFIKGFVKKNVDVEKYYNNTLPIKRYVTLEFDLSADKSIAKSHRAKIDVCEARKIIEELEKCTDVKSCHYKSVVNYFMQQALLDDKSCVDLVYFRSNHGRYYNRGVSLQFLPKEYRDRLLSEYTPIDISAATYSILYNYALAEGYEASKMQTIKQYIDDTEAFRDLVHEFAANKRDCSREYVKKILNAIAFGANINEKMVLSETIYNEYKSVPRKTEGWYTEDVPLNIAACPLVQNLQKEVSGITSFLYKKNKVKDDDGNTFLKNKSKQLMPLNKHVSRGKCLAHLYQSVESEILMSIVNFIYKGKRLIDHSSMIGLLLHDGFYVKTKNLKRFFSLEFFMGIIKKTFGFNIRMVEEI